MEVLINVIGQRIGMGTSLKNFVEGTQNFVKFRFNLDDEWKELTTFAQFTQNGDAYNVLLVDDCACLPPEIVAGKCTMMLYGTGLNDSNSSVIATTNFLTLKIDENILIEGADSTEITPSMYTQLCDLVRNYTTSTDRLEAAIALKADATALTTERERALNAENNLSSQINLKANQSDFEQLESEVAALESGETIASAIDAAVDSRMETLKDNGFFEEMLSDFAVADGSLSVQKVDSAFAAILAQAEGSMQKSIYDPLNYGYDAYSFAQTQDSRLKTAINDSDSYTVTDTAVGNNPIVYTGLKSALNGILNRAELYANAMLSNYSPFTISIVSVLPETGAERTFYLVPKGSGKYDKWWYITDENGNPTWDNFGASSTVVVNELPLVGDEDVDYILSVNGEYQYYKYINNVWSLIAGSTAQILGAYRSGNNVLYHKYLFGTGEPDASLATQENFENDLYFLNTTTMLVYEIVEIGGGDFEWQADTTLVSSPSESKDYFVQDINSMWGHFRYINNAFVQIGSSAYTRDEIDTIISTVNTTISTTRATLEGEIDAIDAKVDQLGNLVSDITETNTGIKVHYKDNTTKDVTTKSNVVTVEDLSALSGNSGLHVTYTDGSTNDIEIAGGGGGGATSGSASITRVTDASTQCVYGDSCEISYILTAVDSAGDITSSGTATWYVNGIKKATSVALQKASSDLPDVINTFDIGQYLNVGNNTVRLSVSVDTGGETQTVTNKTWSVNAVNLYLTWDYDDTTINTSDTVAIRWTPYGDLSKVTHFVIDGVEDEDLQTTTTRSGVQQYVTINKLSHGSHLIELYLTATVNGTSIRSASVYHDMMFVDTSDDTPIISCSLSQYSMTQYNTLQIPIAVYNPTSMTSTLVLGVDGDTVATWRDVDRSLHYWNYTPNDFGTKTLTITCGSVTKTLTIVVSELDIDNDEISGYEFKLKASDIAGNDALQSWNSNGITATFSQNFDWNNGGIKTEEVSGTTRQYICIKAGTTMTINYELFGNDAKINGKNFKIIFKTNNCRDYDAIWLDCLSDGIGIRLGANEGVANSEQNSVSVKYMEGTYIEFEYDIYPDNLSSSAGNAMRYIQTYIDGVISSNNIYAANDNFTQTTKKSIVIGSNDCDVYVYLVKVYETYLTRENHVINFIADAPNAVEMVDRYNRNNVLAENGEIDYVKLANANPNCRVHLWDIPRMTQNKIKKDPVSGCSYQQIYINGSAVDQITAENVTIGVQGTSSLNYITSAANIDGRFESGFTDENGNHTDGYAMTENSIPVNYFNIKVNVASCENVNNMCIAEWYDQHQPYVTGARANVEGGRDCMEHHIGVQFIRDRHEDNEPASAALFTDIDPDGNNYHMYAICNMGNSKENGNVFHDKNNPLEVCIETKDNNSGVCMMTSPLTLEDLDSENFFEFRYPSKPTSEMKQAFIDFVNWMYSRNPAAYTGNALESSVTYEPYTFKGTSEWDAVEQPNEVLRGLTISTYAGTYTHDTYEYRMARLLDECEEHLVMDSIVYHYVFVEEHAMVDNVCKNVFWGTDDLIHWHLCKNYDNDTADGNDNVGKLTIPFGNEGMDTLTTGRDVFNGKMNVYWQFVYGLYPARRLMWQNREAVGTWNADAYLEFANGCQKYLPERVYNQDYWYKYLRPYEQNADTTYISMLEGGKKEHQREGFVRNNLTYMASQYLGTYCTSDSVTLRAYTPTISDTMTEEEKAIVRRTLEVVPPSATFQVMLYNKGYVVVEVGSTIQRIKADKGVYYTVRFADSTNFQETVINVHGASNVRAIGDLSSIYVGWCNFSKASKLRSLTIGSSLEGYTNPNLESVSFESNPMLEELYIQNCPNAATTLNLSGCQSLLNLDVRGSGFTGISFAVGGLIENALLCSPASLTMRSLYYLDDEHWSMDSFDNLTTLRFEDNPGISSYDIVTSASNLTRVRILGIDWELGTTDLLNRMLGLMGLDENDHNTDISVLTGQAYVSGTIRNQEIANYNNAWQNLVVSYNPNYLVTQFLVTYVNADENETVLYSCYVDQGAIPPDPVASGLINAPTIPSTEQYTFTFDSWDGIASQLFTDRTVRAVYTSTVRTYTVTWYTDIGLPITSVGNIEYGSEVIYPGDTPVRTDGNGNYNFHIFKGWDKSTGFIRGDTHVYALWDEANGLPQVSGGTFIPMNEMSPAQIYAVCYAGQQDNAWEDDTSSYFDLEMGVDFDFSNVTCYEVGKNLMLTGITRDTFKNGGYYFDGVDDVFETDIRLLEDNSVGFTIALDFNFSDTTAGGTLFSMASGVSNGLRVFMNNSNPYVEWGGSSNPVCVGYQKTRCMIVLRHSAGTQHLHVYSAESNDQNFQDEVFHTVLFNESFEENSNPITFGAIKFPSNYRNYGKGNIHWCKIWLDDLGDENSRLLASWNHEIVRMEYWRKEAYYLEDGSTCMASFIANNELADKGHRYNGSTNTNVGGWDGSEQREFLNGRFYDGLPTVWKSLIKPVEILATAGNRSTTIVTSYDKIYLPSYREVSTVTDATYIREVGKTDVPIAWFTTNANRIKWRGRIRGYGDGVNIYSVGTEPSSTYMTDIEPGSIWINTSSSSNGYIYLTQEELDHYGLTANISTDGLYASGGWLLSNFWWLRSPYLGNTTSFWVVYGNGGFYGYGATGSFGILPGFSI